MFKLSSKNKVMLQFKVSNPIPMTIYSKSKFSVAGILFSVTYNIGNYVSKTIRKQLLFSLIPGRKLNRSDNFRAGSYKLGTLCNC